ncbi:MAG TPA: Rpn family recombination-promoting nuclease/putative transposase [Ktedonobacteraceae bacterium]|nr:Rpn family recombination-promoting nuclease/putative transposase [Ktedonobacteraceae bacterium]
MGGRRPWDRKMKWIFGIAPEDLVAWLLKDAEFIGLANTDLDEEELYSDILCEIKLYGEKAMLHIEFQKKRDSHMAERLWKYNVRATNNP